MNIIKIKRFNSDNLQMIKPQEKENIIPPQLQKQKTTSINYHFGVNKEQKTISPC